MLGRAAQLCVRGLSGVRLMISDAHDGLNPPALACTEEHFWSTDALAVWSLTLPVSSGL